MRTQHSFVYFGYYIIYRNTNYIVIHLCTAHLTLHAISMGTPALNCMAHELLTPVDVWQINVSPISERRRAAQYFGTLSTIET
jgi:hypothetical protein